MLFTQFKDAGDLFQVEEFTVRFDFKTVSSICFKIYRQEDEYDWDLIGWLDVHVIEGDNAEIRCRILLPKPTYSQQLVERILNTSMTHLSLKDKGRIYALGIAYEEGIMIQRGEETENGEQSNGTGPNAIKLT